MESHLTVVNDYICLGKILYNFEINRLSSALYNSQKIADESRKQLEDILNRSTITAREQRQEMQDVLAELADMECQLIQARLYNRHIASELTTVRKKMHNGTYN